MIYEITTPLHPGVAWGDFVSDEGPPVTITAGGRYACCTKSPDGWYDVLVPVLNPSIARLVLAFLNNISPDDIAIHSTLNTQ